MKKRTLDQEYKISDFIVIVSEMVNLTACMCIAF